MTISIDRFAAAVREAATKFQYYWNRMNEKDPDGFPIAMDAEEWEEQFTSWQELGCPETPDETEEDSDECE